MRSALEEGRGWSPDHVVGKTGDPGEAAGRQRVMDGAVGDGLGEAIYLYACGTHMVREGVIVDPELACDKARSEGLVSVYVHSGRHHLLP